MWHESEWWMWGSASKEQEKQLKWFRIVDICFLVTAGYSIQEGDTHNIKLKQHTYIYNSEIQQSNKFKELEFFPF